MPRTAIEAVAAVTRPSPPTASSTAPTPQLVMNRMKKPETLRTTDSGTGLPPTKMLRTRWGE